MFTKVDKFIKTIIGCPVIIQHKDITEKNAEKERVGVVSDVWFENYDGWYYCSGIIWDEKALDLVINKGWSVSCTYDFESDNTKKKYNGQDITQEFTNGKFLHLAIVPDPRYERANIVLNSKTAENDNPNQKRDERGQWIKDDALIQQKKDNLTPIEIKGEDIPKFETKKELSNWVKGIFEELGSVNIADTNTNVILTSSSANRETSKMRATREENKAVFQQFKDVVEKSIKFDERTADERHIHDQDLYFNKISVDGVPYNVELAFDYLAPNKEYRYAGHKVNNIKTAPSYSQALNALQATGANSIITDTQENFNPENNKAQNNKENDILEQFTDIFYKAAEEVLYPNTVNNGWITLRDKIDEEGNPLRIYIPNYIPQGGAAADFHNKMKKEGNKGSVVYEFTEHTRADVTEEQQSYIKNTVNDILSKFKIEPPLKGVNVCTIGGGCLGVAVSSGNTKTLSLDSKIFKDNGIEAYNQSVKNGWLAKTDKDVLTYVLTHELGHTITADTDNKDFWDNIKDIKSAYCKDVEKDDINNSNYISKYARQDKDEFVAECFAQATLLKTPSRYAKMVLDEVNTHFLTDGKKEKQLRLFNALMKALKMDKRVINKKDDDKETDEITWVEGGGIGFCLTEEDYERRKKEVEKHKEETINK